MDGHGRRTGSDPVRRVTPVDTDPRPGSCQPTVYLIRVQGHLDDRWADSYDGLTVARDAGGDTLLTLPVVDQAALHGLLRKLRDLGVRLVSINPAGVDLPGIASRKEEER